MHMYHQPAWFRSKRVEQHEELTWKLKGMMERNEERLKQLVPLTRTLCPPSIWVNDK